MPSIEVTATTQTMPPTFDYASTFRVMTKRRLERGLGGSVAAPRSSRMLAVLGFALFACGIASISITSNEASASNTTSTGVYLQLNLGVADNILLISIALIAVFAALRAIDTVRLCVYWLSFGLLAYVILMITCPNDATLCPQHQTISTAIVATTLGLKVATLVMWYAYHRLYPRCLAQACCCLTDVTWWWGIEPRGEGPANQFTYRPESRFFPGGLSLLRRLTVRPPRHFGYHGGLDADGKPHGFGTWHDSAAHGEKLTGNWLHGEPVAPFHATEYESGWTFSAARIAYCHNRTEPGLTHTHTHTRAHTAQPCHRIGLTHRPPLPLRPCTVLTTMAWFSRPWHARTVAWRTGAEPGLDEYWWQAKRSPTGLIWGVASVECSVAGGFFKHLPKIVPICGPSPYKSARWCREQLRPTELPTNSTINTPSPAASSGVHEEMSQDAETLSAEAIAVDARAGSLSVTSGGGSPTGGGACADLPGSLHVSADANGLRVGGYARQRLHTLPALATPPLCSRHCTIVTSSHALARVCAVCATGIHVWGRWRRVR